MSWLFIVGVILALFPILALQIIANIVLYSIAKEDGDLAVLVNIGLGMTVLGIIFIVVHLVFTSI